MSQEIYIKKIPKSCGEQPYDDAILTRNDLAEILDQIQRNLERGNNDCALGQRWVLYKMEELEQGEKNE